MLNRLLFCAIAAKLSVFGTFALGTWLTGSKPYAVATVLAVIVAGAAWVLTADDAGTADASR